MPPSATPAAPPYGFKTRPTSRQLARVGPRCRPGPVLRRLGCRRRTPKCCRRPSQVFRRIPARRPDRAARRTPARSPTSAKGVGREPESSSAATGLASAGTVRATAPTPGGLPAATASSTGLRSAAAGLPKSASGWLLSAPGRLPAAGQSTPADPTGRLPAAAAAGWIPAARRSGLRAATTAATRTYPAGGQEEPGVDHRHRGRRRGGLDCGRGHRHRIDARQ